LEIFSLASLWEDCQFNESLNAPVKFWFLGPCINEKGDSKQAASAGTPLPESSPPEPTTKCKFCLSCSVRLNEPAEFLPNPIPEAHLKIGHRPGPALRIGASANRQNLFSATLPFDLSGNPTI
jgi:hypothetical protein